MKRSLDICGKCGWFVDGVYFGTVAEDVFGKVKYFKCSLDTGVYRSKESFEKQNLSKICPYAFEHLIVCQNGNELND